MSFKIKKLQLRNQYKVKEKSQILIPSLSNSKDFSFQHQLALKTIPLEPDIKYWTSSDLNSWVEEDEDG